MMRWAAWIVLIACDGGPAFDAGHFTDSGHDAGMDAGDFDAGMVDAEVETCDPGSTLERFCRFDADCNDLCFCTGLERCQGGVCVAGPPACDDEIDCTIDACDEATLACSSTEDDARCDDMNDCTGVEVCDAEVGCIPGIPMACSDSSSCTIDSCDRDAGCAHTLRDLDGDGHADARCEGGDDCDDDPATGASIHPGAPEICDNFADDNCDGVADQFDTIVCAPTNDTCASARVLPAPGSYDFATHGLREDYTPSCAAAGTLPDAVFRFTTTTDRDVRVEIPSSPVNTTIELRPYADCTNVGTAPIACDRDSSSFSDEAVLEARDVPPGEYAIVVSAPASGFYSLVLSLTSPTPPPATDLCDGVTPVITASGSFDGEFSALADDYADLGCGDLSTPEPEAAYLLRLSAATDVHLEAQGFAASLSQRDVLLALVRDCGAPVTSRIACAEQESSTPPATIDVLALDPGDYWILVEDDDASNAELYTLEVMLTPTADRMRGDVCSSPIEATSTTATADLALLRNDGGLGCGGSGMMYRDAFFSFDVTVPSNVLVTTMAPVFHLFAVSTDCTIPSSELVCQGSNATGRGTAMLSGLAPGRYYVALAVPTDTGTISVTTSITPM